MKKYQNVHAIRTIKFADQLKPINPTILQLIRPRINLPQKLNHDLAKYTTCGITLKTNGDLKNRKNQHRTERNGKY